MKNNEYFKLSDVSKYINQSINVSYATLENYISTVNMMPEKGGITKITDLPKVNMVNSYLENDILISNIRPYFKKIWQATSPGTNSNDVLVIRANNPKIDNKYLYYCLFEDRFFDFMMKSSKGTKMPRGDKDAIMNYEIPLPPLPTQRRIAAILSALDDKIENNRRICETLEQIAQALFKRWFVDNFDKEWEIGQLGDVLSNIESGSRPKGGIDPKLKDGVPSIGAGSINGIGNYDYSKTKFVSREFYNSMKKGTIQDYDVLIYKDGAYVGKKGMFGLKYPYIICTINEHVFILRSNERISQIFLYFLLNEDELAQLNTNSAQPGLNQQSMKSLGIVIPHKRLIEKFTETVKPLIDKILFSSRENYYLTQTRDTLLPKLMSGEVEV